MNREKFIYYPGLLKDIAKKMMLGLLILIVLAKQLFASAMCAVVSGKQPSETKKLEIITAYGIGVRLCVLT